MRSSFRSHRQDADNSFRNAAIHTQRKVNVLNLYCPDHLKNAGLADNTIVGCCSVVTKRFDTGYCVVAGNPAKVVKEEVDWVENVAAYAKNCGSQG
jgi:hypothetical protein